MTVPDEALRRELAEARADRQALTKALTGLTCNGSEFFIRRGDEYVADIEACVAWIRRSRESQQAAVKSALAKRGEAEARIAALQADVARLEAEVRSSSIAWDSTPAENQRLRARIEALEAENSRKDEALRWIENSEPATADMTLAHEMAQVARAALSDAQEGRS